MTSSSNNQPPQEIVLGIVCPMANEAATAVQFVNEVLDRCQAEEFRAVKLFAILDNATRDETRELLLAVSEQRPALQVIWAPENRNVVDAYIRGYREALDAGSDWILEIDAGYSHQPCEIPMFFNKMREGYVCVFGSRFCRGGQMVDAPISRRLVSRGGTIVTNALLGTSLTDMTSGFEMFSRPVMMAILARGIVSQGPFFQTEIKAYCRDLPSAEIPITYKSPSGRITNSTLKDAFQNLWRLFRLKRAGLL